MYYVEVKNDEDRLSDDIRYIFHKKCYICESELTGDGHREHRIPQTVSERYKTSSSNLFWSCARCNNKKNNKFYKESDECRYTDGYCGIIDCTRCDPNNYIRISIGGGMVTEIKIEEKKNAPCNEFTIPLLERVYCSQGKMDTADLYELKNKILDCLEPLKINLKKLHNAYNANVPEGEIDDIVKKIIDCASYQTPFFAIKLSYIEDIYNIHMSEGFDKLLARILQAPDFRPVVNDCCGNDDSVC